MPFELKDYVEVKDRVAEFWRDHPKGRITTTEYVDPAFPDRVIVKASVYRDERDTEPSATGHSWLQTPGSTSYTKGSEIENAETSAVGRALAILGYETRTSIASREEVQSKATTSPVQARSAPEPVRTAREEEPPLPIEPTPVASNGHEGLSSRELFSRAEKAGKKDLLGGVAKDLWGKSRILDLNDSQRGAIAEELGL